MGTGHVTAVRHQEHLNQSRDWEDVELELKGPVDSTFSLSNLGVLTHTL